MVITAASKKINNIYSYNRKKIFEIYSNTIINYFTVVNYCSIMILLRYRE